MNAVRSSFSRKSRFVLALAASFVTSFLTSFSLSAQTAAPNGGTAELTDNMPVKSLGVVAITGSAQPTSLPTQIPATMEAVTREELERTINATDGEDAVNYLSGAGRYADRTKYPLPCILITDLKMPKLTGFDLLTWIQSEMPPNSLPAIVLSGSAQEMDKQRALELGAKAYWVKPTHLADLVHLVHELNETWLAPISHA